MNLYMLSVHYWFIILLACVFFIICLVIHCPDCHNTACQSVGQPRFIQDCSSFTEINVLCSQLLIGQSYSIWHLFILFNFTMHVMSVYHHIFGSVYSCNCIVYAYLPVSELLVSYMNVYGDVISVCLWLGSLLFPLKLQDLTALSSSWTAAAGVVGIEFTVNIMC